MKRYIPPLNTILPTRTKVNRKNARDNCYVKDWGKDNIYHLFKTENNKFRIVSGAGKIPYWQKGEEVLFSNYQTSAVLGTWTNIKHSTDITKIAPIKSTPLYDFI